MCVMKSLDGAPFRDIDHARSSGRRNILHRSPLEPLCTCTKFHVAWERDIEAHENCMLKLWMGPKKEGVGARLTPIHQTRECENSNTDKISFEPRPSSSLLVSTFTSTHSHCQSKYLLVLVCCINQVKASCSVLPHCHDCLAGSDTRNLESLMEDVDIHFVSDAWNSLIG